jgi:transposase
VADPFHLIRLANKVLDEVRRRVQIEQLGSRGRKGDPLYAARKPLVMASERLEDRQRDRLDGLLAAGNPHGEVRDSWHAKETLRWTYSISDPAEAEAFVSQLADELQDPVLAPEVNRLGRTIGCWRTQIVNWHRCRLSNGPTRRGHERRAFHTLHEIVWITKFTHLRVRALLYAGGVNWALLPTLNPA